jgi:hypothetical protein
MLSRIGMSLLVITIAGCAAETEGEGPESIEPAPSAEEEGAEPLLSETVAADLCLVPDLALGSLSFSGSK